MALSIRFEDMKETHRTSQQHGTEGYERNASFLAEMKRMARLHHAAHALTHAPTRDQHVAWWHTAKNIYSVTHYQKPRSSKNMRIFREGEPKQRTPLKQM